MEIKNYFRFVKKPEFKNIFRKKILLVIFVQGLFPIFVLAATPADLPLDPKKWICQGTDQPAPTESVKQFCKERCSTIDKEGKYSRCGISAILKGSNGKTLKPAPLSNLEKKNAYDIALKTFLNDKKYRDELNWASDKNWRLTGPVVGKICAKKEKDCAIKSYGVHPAVRIYYSPEMVEWMCNDREGEIKDGAMIIKEMREINTELGIGAKQCMAIPESQNDSLSPTSWTVMVRDSGKSADGWYWANPTEWPDKQQENKPKCMPEQRFPVKQPTQYDPWTKNPPILDKSAVTCDTFLGDKVLDDKSVVQRNPDWYPTRTISGTENIASIVYPYNLYGGACINCHASAEKNSTFSSLDNILTPGISYVNFNKDEVLHPEAEIKLPTLSQPLKDHQIPKEFNDFYDQYAPKEFHKNNTFNDAWGLRLPAETYDHQVAAADKKHQGFVTSDQCQACHDATISNSGTPNMLLQNDNTKLPINISPYAEWRTSPMGLAGRDPIFFSQLQSETNALPTIPKAVIENTCLHCHGVMGQRQFSEATKNSKNKCDSLFVIEPDKNVPMGECFTLDKVSQWQDKNHKDKETNYGGLARDGISCAVCHRMQNPEPGNDLFQNEKVYTGNFVTGPADEIYGPYKDSTIVTKPMQHALNITPSYSSLISQSDTCGSCHNVLLPVFNNDGTQPLDKDKNPVASYEQTTHLEWLNSDAGQGDTFVSCQGCHMPNSYHNADGELGNVEIANIQSADFAPTTESLPLADIKLTERDNFARHSLHGLNIFLNEMAQQFPILLGLRQIDYMNPNSQPALITGNESMVNMALNNTAKIKITQLHKDEKSGHLNADVSVTNLVGHFFPSGVGFRRVFIELTVEDKKGKLMWSSGRTNKIGVIVDNNNTPLPSEYGVGNKIYQRHYQTINSDSQVQIYQEVITDSDDVITTSFLRRIAHIKDNRLRPKGYDPEFFRRKFKSPYINELAIDHGQVVDDPDYTDPKLTGVDRLSYHIPLTGKQLKNVGEVRVKLYNQSIPPAYLQERFSDASKGKKEQSEIHRLYYMTSHLNTNDAKKMASESPIKDWKLLIAEDQKKLK